MDVEVRIGSAGEVKICLGYKKRTMAADILCHATKRNRKPEKMKRMNKQSEWTITW